eukprot:3336257-Pyramimonas_sp.AAC.1
MTGLSCYVFSLFAGLSEACAGAIKCFYIPDGFHFHSGGMVFDIDGDRLRLFAKWAWCCKTAALTTQSGKQGATVRP